jgi:hypothetical protein
MRTARFQSIQGSYLYAIAALVGPEVLELFGPGEALVFGTYEVLELFGPGEALVFGTYGIW